MRYALVYGGIAGAIVISVLVASNAFSLPTTPRPNGLAISSCWSPCR